MLTDSIERLGPSTNSTQHSKMVLTSIVSSSLIELPQWLPPMSVSPRQVQLTSCLFGRLLQNHQASLSLVPSKLLPLSGIWITWDFCMGSLRRESQFPIAVQLPYMQVLLILKGRHSVNSFHDVGPLGWGPSCGTQSPCSLRRTSVIVVVIPFIGYTADIVGCILTVPSLHLSHPSCCGSSFIPLVVVWEVKWDWGSITMNKTSGGDGIPVKLFQY